MTTQGRSAAEVADTFLAAELCADLLFLLAVGSTAFQITTWALREESSIPPVMAADGVVMKDGKMCKFFDGVEFCAVSCLDVRIMPDGTKKIKECK